MFDVIYDPEKQIAALIDPDAGRALGPIVSAETDAVRLLELFVGGIDADPASLHPADLEALFHGFVDALNAEPPAEPAAGAAPAAATPPGAAAEPAAAAAPQPPGASPHTAGPGETGQVAGPTAGTEAAAPPGGHPGAHTVTEQVADGGLPSGVEQAAVAGAPAPSTPPATPAAAPAPDAGADPTPGFPPPPQ